jgi:hypothetical protein
MIGNKLFFSYFFLIRRIECNAIAANKISDIWSELLNFEVIGIDEGQFYEDVSLFN